MSESRSEVKNAANPAQVHAAGRRVNRREARFLSALRVVMATPEGRLVFGERSNGLLARLGIYEMVWRPNAEIHRAAARHDVGVEITALLLTAGEDFYEVMERECRTIARRDAGETDAAHTALAGEQGSE